MQIKSPLRHARRNCVCMRLCLMFLLVGLLGACATSTPPRKVAPVVAQSVHPVSRDDDQLLKLIAAEMALQRNDMQAAALLVGPEMAALAERLEGKIELRHVPHATAAREALAGFLAPGDVILIKGSNAIGLGGLVQALASGAFANGKSTCSI